MLQLHLSPRHSQCRPAPPRVSQSEHVGAHQNGLTCSQRSYATSVRPSISCVPFHNWSGTWQCHRVMHTYSVLLSDVCRCSRLPPWPSPILVLYFTGKCFPSPPHSVSLHLRTHCVGNLLQSIPQRYFVGGFPQMQVLFFPPSNGKTELHRSGLCPDRQKNTNKINLCQLHLEPG